MTTIFREEQAVVSKQVIDKVICDWCGLEGSVDAPAWREVISDEIWASDSLPGWRISDLCPDCNLKLRAEMERMGIKVVDWL